MSAPPRPPSLSVFFPACNDAGTIASLVIRAVQVAERLTNDFEVIVVNDGSTDATQEIVDELATAYDGRMKVAKVNIDQNRATAIKYHVRSIPMLLLFKDGQIQATQVGAVGKGQLTQMIDKTI